MIMANDESNGSGSMSEADRLLGRPIRAMWPQMMADTEGDAKESASREGHSHSRGGAPPMPVLQVRRACLPLNTDAKRVPPHQTALITSPPQRAAFRPERFFVSSHEPKFELAPLAPLALASLVKRPWWKFWQRAPDPQMHALTSTIALLRNEIEALRSDRRATQGAAAWLINDISIGNRSQFAQAGSLPGDMFSSSSIDSFVSFDTCQTAMDVTVSVTYEGDIPAGCPFYGSMLGLVVAGSMDPMPAHSRA
jgi:hypothetical protein